MRDINRIDRVLSVVRECWLNVPDWRLGQLLINAIRDVDLFYVEDDQLEERLKAMFEKN